MKILIILIDLFLCSPPITYSMFKRIELTVPKEIQEACNNPANHKDYKRTTGAAVVRYDKQNECLIVIVCIHLKLIEFSI